MSYLDRLNPEQKTAAEHFEGPLLVLAGAGSGKTRVLTSRIAHLIEEYGVAPDSILSLTFTNKAAAEMRSRVRALLDRDPAGMWIGTFHAIGARMLRRDASRMGWTPGFLIYDAEDSERLVRRILRDDLKLDTKKWSPKAVRSAISSAKNELLDHEGYAKVAFDPFSRVVAQVFERYERALHDANAFDFDDLLVKPVNLLQRFPEVLRRYRERFHFVMVDEYQDTNHAQYIFLKLLAERSPDIERGLPGAGGNLFVVGDDDQLIYGWRGANIRNILDFEGDFPDAEVVRLEENYRSTQRILDAANHVISQNVNRKGKILRTANPPGEILVLVEANDETDEANWISEAILAELQEASERTARDFVVLYRTNAQSRALEEAFLRERIPYTIIGGQRFYERREVKDVLAYLRLLANPADDEAFLRIANVPRRGIGDASLGRLAEMAASRGVPLLHVARSGQLDGIRGGAARALHALAELLQKYAAYLDLGRPLEHIARELVGEIGFLEALSEDGPDGEDRIANVNELIASVAEFETRLASGDEALAVELEDGTEDLGILPINLFLSHVALVTEVDKQDPNAAVVSLMTLHNAKGLEFPVVFVAGLEEGLFPLARTMEEPDQLEEERRLFYVGITRAEQKLFLTTARRRRRAGEWMDAVPSSFLESIPPVLIDVRQTDRAQDRSRPRFGYRQSSGMSTRRDRIGLEPRRVAKPVDQVVDYSDSQENVRLVKGARVRHPQFGSGTVLEVGGFGTDIRAAIEFDTVGRKQVVVRYANLQADWD